MSDLIEAWVLAERHVVLQDLAPTRQRAPKAPQEITGQSFLRFENTLCSLTLPLPACISIALNRLESRTSIASQANFWAFELNYNTSPA